MATPSDARGVRPGGFAVRTLGPGDERALWELRGRALRESPDAFATHADEHPSLPDFARRQAERWVDPAVRTLGAWRGAVLLGMVVVVRESRLKTRHRAGLHGMYVAPEARREGVGEALVRAALSAARGLGAERLELAVAAPNGAARRLYERVGFQAWGVQPAALRIDGSDVDEVWMALALEPPAGATAS